MNRWRKKRHILSASYKIVQGESIAVPNKDIELPKAVNEGEDELLLEYRIFSAVWNGKERSTRSQPVNENENEKQRDDRPVQVLVRNFVLPYSTQTYGSCLEIHSVSFNLEHETTAMPSIIHS